MATNIGTQKELIMLRIIENFWQSWNNRKVQCSRSQLIRSASGVVAQWLVESLEQRR